MWDICSIDMPYYLYTILQLDTGIYSYIPINTSVYIPYIPIYRPTYRPRYILIPKSRYISNCSTSVRQLWLEVLGVKATNLKQLQKGLRVITEMDEQMMKIRNEPERKNDKKAVRKPS